MKTKGFARCVNVCKQRSPFGKESAFNVLPRFIFNPSFRIGTEVTPPVKLYSTIIKELKRTSDYVNRCLSLQWVSIFELPPDAIP